MKTERNSFSPDLLFMLLPEIVQAGIGRGGGGKGIG